MIFSFSRTIPVFLVLTVFLFPPLSSAAELVDRVVAVVNNEAITKTELDNSWEPISRRIRERTSPDKLDETLKAEKDKVFANLIDDLLINQEAVSMKVSVSEEEIDEAMGRVAENNSMSIEELKKELEQSAIDIASYRKNIHNNIQRSKLISRKINSKIVISDEKAKEYYEKVFTSQNTDEEGYHILQIGFTWGTKESSSATADDARKRANEIKKLVDEGQDFSELARSFSELPSAEDGGNLGFLNEDDMSKKMQKILVGLEPGKASEVIEMSGSYQFFMILSANLNGTTTFAPFEVFKNKIVGTLYNEEQKKRYENWMKEMRERAYIKTLL